MQKSYFHSIHRGKLVNKQLNRQHVNELEHMLNMNLDQHLVIVEEREQTKFEFRLSKWKFYFYLLPAQVSQDS